MQGLDDSPGRCLVITDLARKAIECLCRDHGRQAVVLSWPGGARCLPIACYEPGEYDVIVGHVAGCPIYADVRQLGWSAHGRVLLGITEVPRPGHRPLLQMRYADCASSFAGAAV
jgi:uncharacterized protein (DUF779 family)